MLNAFLPTWLPTDVGINFQTRPTFARHPYGSSKAARIQNSLPKKEAEELDAIAKQSEHAGEALDAVWLA
jgi:hypothetical protein